MKPSVLHRPFHGGRPGGLRHSSQMETGWVADPMAADQAGDFCRGVEARGVSTQRVGPTTTGAGRTYPMGHRGQAIGTETGEGEPVLASPREGEPEPASPRERDASYACPVSPFPCSDGERASDVAGQVDACGQSDHVEGEPDVLISCVESLRAERVDPPSTAAPHHDCSDLRQAGVEEMQPIAGGVSWRRRKPGRMLGPTAAHARFLQHAFRRSRALRPGCWSRGGMGHLAWWRPVTYFACLGGTNLAPEAHFESQRARAAEVLAWQRNYVELLRRLRSGRTPTAVVGFGGQGGVSEGVRRAGGAAHGQDIVDQPNYRRRFG